MLSRINRQTWFLLLASGSSLYPSLGRASLGCPAPPQQRLHLGVGLGRRGAQQQRPTVVGYRQVAQFTAQGVNTKVKTPSSS